MINVEQAIAWLSKCNPKAVLRVSYPEDSDSVTSVEEVFGQYPRVYLCTTQIDWENDENIPIEVVYAEANFRQVRFLQRQQQSN